MRYDDLMSPKAYISRRLYEGVKLSSRRACHLAAAAGLDSSTLSLALHRRRKVRMNDPRILKLGKLVGLKKSEIFEPIPKESAA